MPFDAAALIIGDVAILITGAWAWLRNRESGAARGFFIATIAYAFWLTVNYFSLQPYNLELVDVLTRLTYAAGVWLMVAAWYFCYKFPIERKPSLLLRVSSGIILLLGTVFSISMFVVEGVSYTASGDLELQLHTVGNGIYGLLLGGLAIACVVSLWRNYGQARISQRNQIRYVAFGIGSSTVLSITFNVILVPLFGPVWGSPIANLLVTLPVLLFLGYGLIRHRYVEVRRLSSILLSTVICFVLLVGIFALTDFAVRKLYPDSELYQQFGLLLAITLAVLGIQAMQTRLRHFTDTVLGVGWYDSQLFLNTLGETLAGDLRIQPLMENSLKQLGDILRLTGASFIRHNEDGTFVVNQYGTWETEVTKETFDFTQLARAEKLLIIEELSRKHPLYQVMRDSHIRAVVPLETQGQRVGYLLLGVKRNGDIFSSQDVTLLQIIARQLAITVISAEAFEQINRFNITLKHQVAEATADLRAANEKLKLDDRMKSEFIMLTSHNLRTPLSILGGYTSLLLESQMPDEQRKMVVGMQESLGRLTQFTEDLLAIDSLAAGNQLQLQPMNVHELLAPLVKEAESAAAHKNITFAAELAVLQDTQIAANQIRLTGALRSVLDNACKFTSEGGVTLEVFMETSTLTIKVTDTGIGIDQAELPHIFEKFHRATELMRYDYEGEGISLYLTKLVVQEHKGTIGVVSTKQKGTVVTVTLPVLQPNMDSHT